jgi:hypothetical protein
LSQDDITITTEYGSGEREGNETDVLFWLNAGPNSKTVLWGL